MNGTVIALLSEVSAWKGHAERRDAPIRRIIAIPYDVMLTHTFPSHSICNTQQCLLVVIISNCIL